MSYKYIPYTFSFVVVAWTELKRIWLIKALLPIFIIATFLLSHMNYSVAAFIALFVACLLAAILSNIFINEMKEFKEYCDNDEGTVIGVSNNMMH